MTVRSRPVSAANSAPAGPERHAPSGTGSAPGTGMAASVLALNRHYVAVHVFSAPRTFCLLCKGIAEVVHWEDGAFQTYDFENWSELSELKATVGDEDEHDDWVRTVHSRIQVPRVIRLLHYDRVPRNSVKFNRRNIFLRDEHRCQYCSRRLSQQKLSVDHVMPRSRGGGNTWDNVVCACLTCNVRKGGRTPAEAGMHLLRPPVKPARSPSISRHLAVPKYALWRHFLSADRVMAESGADL